jgi:NADH:ubiquinone oxidoreductase subunit F (NADH-binding)
MSQRHHLPVLERARRVGRDADREHLFDELRAGRSSADCSLRHGLRAPAVDAIRSFYDLLSEPDAPHTCVGTACWLAADSGSDIRSVHCLGRCYEAPARSDEASTPIPRISLVDPPIVLRHLLGECRPREDYDLPDGVTILERVEQSGLRGRGGAAFPTAAKWRVARQTSAPDRCVVANGDEGDPGAYIDRLLLEEAPHSILAGMLACGRAIDAHVGVVFVRGEYPRAREAMSEAIRDAERLGWLDDFSVRVVGGAGSYVAGEETALLRAIEGLRAEPSPKPPYPAERGLWGLPTVVQNIETLSIIPWLVRHQRRGDTKAVCLSGAVARPGVVEVALGASLRDVLEKAGSGVPHGERWKLALVGGPMGRVVPERLFDLALSYESLPGMGHGGVVVMGEQVTARALFDHLVAFARSESCGNCTPCRVGTSRLSNVPDRSSLERLLETLELGSLCGFGQGVPRPIRDLIEYFPDELFPAGAAT